MAGIAVIGPGAVGVTFAAAAERAGHEVALCGRRPGPAPVLELPDGGEQALSRPVSADPQSVRPVAWVLLAVKAHQVAGAAGWLRALCGPGTVVAALQNGVEHHELVGPFAGAAHVLPVIVWCPSEVIMPGRVRQRGPARLSVPDEPPARRLARLLDAQVDPVPDFRTEAWRKLCMNATAAPMVLTGRRAEVFGDPEQLALARAIAHECVAVARAEGADLAPADAEAILGGLAAMPPDLGTSMLFDRLAGRRLEWDARNGVIARLGRRHGIPTPVSDDVAARLAALDGAG